MDRNLARKNIRSGIVVTAVCCFMFGMTFVAAAMLHLRGEAHERRRAPD